MKNIVVLTGAGISAESGVKTFRDSGGLWEGHDVMEVASPQGWNADKEMVLEFYNQRRKQLLTVQPNKAHFLLSELEKFYKVSIITQNVDDLHERGGALNVLHLHGELFKVRSTRYEDLIYDWKKDLNLGDLCDEGYQLRPHIVWFGEAVPMLGKAIEITQKADIFIIIGTSMQVYPAASLIQYTKPKIPIYFIDPNPANTISYHDNITVFSENASTGMERLMKILVNEKI
ncbi:MAG: NAD-dependent deacylase [Bacteroidota bacterium]